ncbi:UDP-N-acetylmuramoyl-tripeptide--D-alanyl-D-alanine ligase [Paenarthrobacter sp. DKR-5]|uniref:UDP-N-acetylmuramoyl-tripeptide--D-alanyl-D- alanine ligase n=1 Tax=Paenarthrobacter sp. DKR-5 TaxID=2835535 RepID=UPI001BDCA8F6|nr:UDP-N-acetylmuramoyl-tripeptide--D-alanyl-D-alanine ligase [Paenarthrobacter sp. DKR-5]MBT1002154.1 UDP-N-acetylmuramoyl-tripeptide--D-alanyl-D-alanine ligase [Paenarthrobacter sp. DKR-5]
MIELNAAQIAGVTGGRLTGSARDANPVPTSVATDSREVLPGAMYVAKPGEHADGHEFMQAAFERGAVLALAEREVLDSSGQPYPAVIVDDAVLAMGALAAETVRRIRARGPLTVVGITGSAGKTTTKDLLAGILRQQGPTVAPQGSYNGEVGVPLTVFRADYDTRYLVIEMGATGIGHIKYLADMVRPDLGVVLVVGSAHAGEFGGVENIAIAKGEMVEALAPEGTAVINLDDPRVAAMRSRTKATVLGFSQDAAAAADVVRAEDPGTNSAGNPVFTLHLPGAPEGFPVQSRLIGAHHITNLLAAAAAAHAIGIPGADIAASLNSQAAASRWRMERTERADGVTVINDAYNANPESMRAALRTLADVGRGRRTWAVLGPMLELGADSVHEHDAIGRIVVRLNISRLIVVGAEAKAMHNAAVMEGSWGDESMFVPDADAAYEVLSNELEPGDLVLFKSSNSAGLRFLGDRIALPPQSETAGTAPAGEGREPA